MQLFSKRTALMWVGVLAMMMLAIVPATAQQPTVDFRPGVVDAARADGQARVIIELTTDVSASTVNARLQQSIAQAQASVLSALGPNQAGRDALYRSNTFQLLHQYESNPALAGVITLDGLDAIANHPAVVSVKLDSTGTGGLAEARAIINADDVVTNLGITGEGVKIAVVDSGVDLDHVFLSDDVNEFGVCFTNGDCPPNDTNFSDNADDENGHGTAIAGAITSSSGAHPGIAPDVVVVPVRVMDTQNTGFESDWIAGLDWIISNQGGLGVNVVNISIQTAQTFSAACDAIYPSLATAVNQLVNSGVPVVSITGNFENTNAISAPGCLSNVIAVGATYDFNGNFSSGQCNDATATIDEIACFTNSAGIMDIVAPGATIMAPQINTANNSVFSGTSIAAPMVSAVMAMLLDINPALTPAELETIIKETGTTVTDPRNGLSFPRVDALAAVATQLQGVELIGPNGTVLIGDPLFQWEDLPTSPQFRVQVRNIGLDAVTADVTLPRGGICNGAICEARLDTQLISGSNQFRVQTFANVNTPAVWSNWMSFNAIGPEIISPVSDSNVNETNPTYSWEAVDGATWYRLYVGGPIDSLTFDDHLQWYEASEVCLDGVCTVTPPNIADQRYDGTNVIYVQSWLDDKFGVWAGPVSFTVDVPLPSQPVLQATTDTDTLIPTYNWSLASSNAYYTEIRVSDAEGMILLQEWLDRPASCGDSEGTECSYESPITLTDGAAYTVEIRGWGPGGLTSFTTPQAFNITLEKPVTPTGLSVEENRGDPTFTWINDDAAEWFNLVVVNANTNSNVLDQWYQRGDGADCGELICALTPDIYLQNGTYNWSLRTWGNGSFSPATAEGDSIVLSFSAPVPPQTDTMVTLRVNLEVWNNKDRLVYQWPDVDGASWYNVEIRRPDGTVLVNEWYRRTEICAEGDCSAYPVLYLTNGNSFEWEVRAWGPGGMGNWSDTATFTVNGGAQSTAPDVSAATPTGTITTSYPTFTWPTRPGTTWMQLSVTGSDAGEVYNAWFEASQLGCAGGAGTCTADQEALGGLELLDASYAYQIRFYGPAGLSPWSAQRGFVVDAPAASQVQTILAPAGGATVPAREITFQWNASANTTWYRMQAINQVTDEVIDTWRTAEDLGCVTAGDVCTLLRVLDTGVYEWTIATWGPGTPGTNFATTTPRELSVLN